MPDQTASFSLPDFMKDDLLALSYGSFRHLEWTVKYAKKDKLIGFTKLGWARGQEPFVAEVVDGSVTITIVPSTKISFDLRRKNKTSLSKFSEALQAVKPLAREDKLAEWKKELVILEETTTKEEAAELKNKKEQENVMSIAQGSKIITYSIISINIGVFLLMLITGVNIFKPRNIDLLNWGANFRLFTVDDREWWRLFTSTFLHVGLLHLLFNMYALYVVGIFLEPMLGKLRFITAYVCTGILASVVSMLYHDNGVISAGASGAIFGLYGVFLALLTTKLIPDAMRKPLLQSIVVFIGYNLISGLKSGVDNSAHLGGLISGFLIGYIYYPALKNGATKKTAYVAAVVIAGTIALVGVFIFKSTG